MIVAMKGKMPSGWILPALALAAILVHLAGPEVQEALRFEREAVLAGELWRLLSAHLTHLGWPHTIWNGAALIVISLLFGRTISDLHWVYLTVICAAGVGIGLLAFKPEIAVYVGFSGVLHGLFAAGALTDRHAHPETSSLMLGLLGVKVVWEQLAGPLPGTEAAVGGLVLVDAHLYGAILGVIGVAILHAFGSQKGPDPQ